MNGMDKLSPLNKISIVKERASRFRGVYRCGKKWKAQVILTFTHSISMFL